MLIPEGVPQLLLFLFAIAPGVTYSTVKVLLVGWRSPDYGSAARLLEALYVSVIFLAAYALFATLAYGLMFGPEGWTPSAVEAYYRGIWTGWPAWLVALLICSAVFVIPGLAAGLLNLKVRRVHFLDSSDKPKTKLKAVNNARPIPRAWDAAAFEAYTPRFVRVRTEGGLFFGGWFGGNSYVSTYPHSRDIFAEAEWNMGPNGEFESEVEGTLGVWLHVADGSVVQWLRAPDQHPTEVEDRVEK